VWQRTKKDKGAKGKNKTNETKKKYISLHLPFDSGAAVNPELNT
jgi:hypothetical protein